MIEPILEITVAVEFASESPQDTPKARMRLEVHSERPDVLDTIQREPEWIPRMLRDAADAAEEQAAMARPQPIIVDPGQWSGPESAFL